MNKIVGIDKEKLKKIILNIYEYRDKINTIFNDVEYLIDETKQYYDSDDGDYFRQKLSQLCSNRSVVLSNIKSYCEDLEKVIHNFEKNEDSIVTNFKGYSKELDNQSNNSYSNFNVSVDNSRK